MSLTHNISPRKTAKGRTMAARAKTASRGKAVNGARFSTQPLSYAQLIANAEALVPVFAARAEKTENMRMLPKENMDDLYRAGLLRVVAPKRYGGLEMDWPALPEVARVVARGCPSTAWIVSVVGGHAAIVGRMPKAVQDEMFADGPNQLFVTASAQTTGKFYKAKGGVIVDGIWRFASGCDHADWIMVNSELFDDKGNKIAPNLRIIVRPHEVEIVDSWHVAGMKGTGSKDLKFNKVFVPDVHVIDSPTNFQAGPPGAAVNPGCYLYDVPFGPYFSSWLLGPVLGAAEGAYASYVAATKGRVGSMTQQTVAQIHTVQERIAVSYCELEAARALYDKHNAFLHQRGAARRNIAVDEFIDSGRERTYIGRLCFNLVQRLVQQMGAIGIYDSNPVQRFYRDLNVMQNQLALNWDVHMLNFGRRQLGLPTGMDRLDNPPPDKKAWGLANGKAKRTNGKAY